MTITAGIVMKNKFISPGDKRYQAAIDYLDKEKAKRQNNRDQFHFFSDELPAEKSVRLTGLFDGQQDALDQEGKKKIKQSFLEAQEQGSPMWQTVFSFDNDFLKELGLYKIGEHGFLDEAALRDATRRGMDTLINEQGLGSTGKWAAAIHYDTDNIHIHTMLVSTDPAKVLKQMTYKNHSVYRGKLFPKTQRAAKSKFANTLAHRDPTLARLSFLMRTGLVRSSLDKGYNKNLHVMRSISQLLQVLPSDRRQWRYGNQSMAPYREQIDALSSELVRMNNPELLAEFDQLLTEQSDFYLRAYGPEAVKGNEEKTFRDTHYEQLYKNLGNALLRELSSSISSDEWKQKKHYTPEEIAAFLEKKRAPLVTKQAVERLGTVLEETTQDYLNKLAYQRETYRKERERAYELEQQNGRSY